jgi:hypothetical protein
LEGIYAVATRAAEQHRHVIRIHSSTRTGVRNAASRFVDTALVAVDAIIVFACEAHLRSKGRNQVVNQDLDQFPRTGGDETSGTPSEIFNILWGALVEILGSPATATLLRRSAKRRLRDFPELGELAITRKGFEYVYAVPADWKHANEQSNAALQALVQDLYSLLFELTGPVVLHRLEKLPQLAKCGLSVSEDK